MIDPEPADYAAWFKSIAASLAAKDAEIARLRDVLRKIESYNPDYVNGGWSWEEYKRQIRDIKELARTAISLN